MQTFIESLPMPDHCEKSIRTVNAQVEFTSLDHRKQPQIETWTIIIKVNEIVAIKRQDKIYRTNGGDKFFVPRALFFLSIEGRY